MVQDALNALCDDFNGCETLAYADLSSRMVLVTNTKTPESQDTLNILCQEANLLLEHGNSAMSGTAGQMHVFIRSEDEPSDALCCICTMDVDFARLLPAMQVCLATISDDGSAK